MSAAWIFLFAMTLLGIGSLPGNAGNALAPATRKTARPRDKHISFDQLDVREFQARMEEPGREPTAASC